MIRCWETGECRRRLLLGHFGEDLEQDCGHCDNCAAGEAEWDATLHVEKALLCMLDTNQRFGAGYLAEILMGKSNKRVTQNGHGRLRTFGLGSDLGAEQWKSVFAQMVGKGLVDVDTSGYSVLRLNDQSGEVLNGRLKVLLHGEPVPLPSARRASDDGPRKRARSETRPRVERPAKAPAPARAGAVDTDLFRGLRKWRWSLADDAEVPAFVIMSDATLRELAACKPLSLNELAQVKGIGPAKLEHYGEALLRVIREHE